MTFIEHLTLALQSFEKEGHWSTLDKVAEMVNNAAHAATIDIDAEMSVTKMVSPDGLRVMHTLFIGPDKDDWVLLYSDDLAYLRAMLCNYDENVPACIGDSLTISTRDEHGRITTKVTQTMIDANLRNDQDHI